MWDLSSLKPALSVLEGEISTPGPSGKSLFLVSVPLPSAPSVTQLVSSPAPLPLLNIKVIIPASSSSVSLLLSRVILSSPIATAIVYMTMKSKSMTSVLIFSGYSTSTLKKTHRLSIWFSKQNRWFLTTNTFPVCPCQQNILVSISHPSWETRVSFLTSFISLLPILNPSQDLLTLLPEHVPNTSPSVCLSLPHCFLLIKNEWDMFSLLQELILACTIFLAI